MICRYTHHTTSQPPREQRKAQKQHKPRLPRHLAAAIAVAVGAQPRLLDQVDHQHPQRGADPGDPVNELDVHVGAIARAVREGRGVDEEEESEGEL